MSQFVLHVRRVDPTQWKRSRWSIWSSRCEERWTYRETFCSRGTIELVISLILSVWRFWSCN